MVSNVPDEVRASGLKASTATGTLIQIIATCEKACVARRVPVLVHIAQLIKEESFTNIATGRISHCCMYRTLI